MKTLIAWISIVILFANCVTSDQFDEKGMYDGELGYMDGHSRNALDVFTNVERRKWCGQWDDYCKPNTRKKYQLCCPNLRCMCGILWGRATCKCKGRTFGR